MRSANDQKFSPPGLEELVASRSARGKVIICTYLPMNTGAGVERFVLLLSNALTKAGIRSEVVDIDAAGISNRILRRFRYYCAMRVGTVARRRARGGDIIVCNNYFSWNAPRRGIVVFHGTDAGRARQARQDIAPLRRLVVQIAGSYLERRAARGRTIVAVSSAAKEEVELHYGMKVDFVIPNAVDLAKFSPSKDRKTLRAKLGLPTDKFLILFVGTTDRRKGLDWILEELKPNLDENQELVLRVDLAGPPEGVRVLGRVPIDLLADLYRACDVLLFPTNYEGCSFGLVEALACGLPVITSPAGSGRDLLDREELRPYVIDGRDRNQYLACIRRLQESEEEWLRVSAACRAIAEGNHDLHAFENAYVDVIRRSWTGDLS